MKSSRKLPNPGFVLEQGEHRMNCKIDTRVWVLESLLCQVEKHFTKTGDILTKTTVERRKWTMDILILYSEHFITQMVLMFQIHCCEKGL